MDVYFTLNDAFRRCGSVSNQQLQRAWGISRQAVWKRLKPLVDSGELQIDGIGRGVRYRPGPGSSWRDGVVRGGDLTSSGFWVALCAQVKGLVYVAVGRAARGTLRGDHARALLMDLDLRQFVILDFAGVERVGARFAAALFSCLEVCSSRLAMINVSKDVARALARARRLDGLRPKST